MESAFGGYTSSYLILALHGQIFDCLRERFTDILGVPRIGSFRKKSYSYGNAWLVLPILKARGWSGYVFATNASPRNSTQNWVCYPLPRFMAVRKIPNVWLSSGYCKRHSWPTQFGAFCLNQPLYMLCRIACQKKIEYPGVECYNLWLRLLGSLKTTRFISVYTEKKQCFALCFR